MAKNKVTKQNFSDFIKWYSTLTGSYPLDESEKVQWWTWIRNESYDHFKQACGALYAQHGGDFDLSLIIEQIGSQKASIKLSRQKAWKFDLNALSESEKNEKRQSLQWAKMIELISKIGGKDKFDSEDYYLFHARLHGVAKSIEIAQEIAGHFPDMARWQNENHQKMVEAVVPQDGPTGPKEIKK